VAYGIGTGSPASWAKNAGQRNLTAQRGGKLDAARNLLELIKGIQLNSESSLDAEMSANDKIRTTVEGRLAGVRQVGKPKYFSDGTIQIKLQASLREVVPAELFAEGAATKTWGPPDGGTGGINASVVYTGLIIDARGKGLVPAMSPRVVDPKGEEVYGASFVSREFAISQGVVGYGKNVDAAKKSDRVKGNPLVVKAVNASGATKTDVVISQNDANALREIAQKQTFLKECRVMIVLD